MGAIRGEGWAAGEKNEQGEGVEKCLEKWLAGSKKMRLRKENPQPQVMLQSILPLRGYFF